MGNHSAMHRLYHIYDVLTVSLGYNGDVFFMASLYMKSVVTARDAIMGTSFAYLPRDAANSLSIEVCNHALLR